MITQQILILFGLACIGYFIRKKELVSDNFINDCTNYALYVSMPCFLFNIITGTTYSNDKIGNMKNMLIISIIGFFTLIIISNILSKYIAKERKKMQVLKFAFIFSNVGFMGLPIVFSVYGEEGIFFASIVNLVFNILLFTLGVYIYTGGKGEKFKYGNIINPAVISIIIGFVFFFLKINVPIVLSRVIEIAGSSTTLFSMLVIGMIISKKGIDFSVLSGELVIGILLKNIVIPFSLIIFLSAIFENNISLKIFLITMSMPAGSTTAMFAYKYKSDYAFASEIITFSTILSVVSIPILLYII